MFTWNNLPVLKILKILTRCASFGKLSMVWNIYRMPFFLILVKNCIILASTHLRPSLPFSCFIMSIKPSTCFLMSMISLLLVPPKLLWINLWKIFLYLFQSKILVVLTIFLGFKSLTIQGELYYFSTSMCLLLFIELTWRTVRVFQRTCPSQINLQRIMLNY